MTPHSCQSISTFTNQYTQIKGVHPKITHLKPILGCTFFKVPITHTQSMFLCKLFSMAIHSMGYFCHVKRLYADEWKLMFLCPNQLGHYIIYFHSSLKNFETSQLSYILCTFPYWLLIRVKDCMVYKLLEVNCNRTKSTGADPGGPRGPGPPDHQK